MEHHVYFWLKEGADRATFEQGLQSLKHIEQIAGFFYGTPAPTEVRPVTDNSWDFALSLKFDTVADHDAYQVHPLHDEFVDGFKSMWTKVQVMDVA